MTEHSDSGVLMEGREGAGKQIRVLVIEKDERVASSMERLINEVPGIRVDKTQTVANLKEAQELIKKASQDRIPVEMVVTGMLEEGNNDGFYSIGGIRELGVRQVVLIGGKDAAGLSREQLEKMGINYSLSKPAIPREIVDAVGKAVAAILNPNLPPTS